MDRLSTAVTLSTACCAVLVTAVSVLTLVCGGLGLVGLVWGIYRGSSRSFTTGSAFLFCSVLVAGLHGMAPAFLLVAGLSMTIATAVGHNGFSIGQEVGPTVSCRRIVLWRTVATTVVFGLGSAMSYLLFLTVPGGQPVVALLALLVGLVLLLIGTVE